MSTNSTVSTFRIPAPSLSNPIAPSLSPNLNLPPQYRGCPTSASTPAPLTDIYCPTPQGIQTSQGAAVPEKTSTSGPESTPARVSSNGRKPKSRAGVIGFARKLIPKR